MKKEKQKFTVVSQTNKILYVGIARDVAIKYGIDRNTVYQASYGKFLVKGKYTIREATAEETEIKYPSYFVARPTGRVKVIIEEPKKEIEEKPKVHIPQKYRSSSGHRFSKL